MTETTSPSELDLSRLQRRALAAAQLAGCSTPPAFVAQLDRPALIRMLDGMELPTGDA
jgi:hypothetical protein